MDDPNAPPKTTESTSRWFFALAMLALGAAVLWKLAGLIVLLFGAIILAIVFDVLADGLRRLAPIPKKLAILASAALVFGILASVLLLYGWSILSQYKHILEKVREGSHALLVFARAHDWSQILLRRANRANISDATDTLGPLLGSLLGATSRYLAYGGIALVSGIFLALEPGRYMRGALLLVPPANRDRASEFLAQSGSVLRRWLISRLIAMAAIGALASIGLKLLGVDAAITLGLTGALLKFIPYIGALVAAAAAVLVAFTVRPALALLTGLLFWALYIIEGAFIVPMVQDSEVALPPVLTIFSTLAFAILLGPSGVIVASPLALVGMVAVRIFYLEDRLGEFAPPLVAKPHGWPWPKRKDSVSRPR